MISLKQEMLIKDFKVLERLLKPNKVYHLNNFRPIKRFSIDSRSIKKGEAFIAIRGLHHDGHSFIKNAIRKGAVCIIAQKYLPASSKIPFFIVKDTYKALGAIANYIRKKKNPFVYAITGSLGKTTTKEMLFFLLKDKFKVLKNKGTENNFLGVSKTIISLSNEEVVILELGTNAKGEMRSLAEICLPNIGIITFIKPAHLEGLGNLRGVWKEKISLFKVCPKAKPVLNCDDNYLAKTKTAEKIFWFGQSKKSDLFVRLKERKKSKSVFLIQNKYELILPFYWEEFIGNVLAALSGAYLLGIPLGELVEKMNYFRGSLPMRMQKQKLNGLFILNDAYNANPYSFLKAFGVLANCSLRKIAVIADMLELGKRSLYYHRLLAPSIIKSNFDYCLMLGKDTLYLKERLYKLGYKRAYHFSSHAAIARFITQKMKGKETCRKRYLIFLKGSRKMELEKVIDYL